MRSILVPTFQQSTFHHNLLAQSETKRYISINNMYESNGQSTRQFNNESEPRFVGKSDLKTTSTRQAIPQSSSTATQFPLSNERIISPPMLPDMGFRYQLPPDLFQSYSSGLSHAVPGSHGSPKQNLSFSGSAISPRHLSLRNSCTFVTPEVAVTKFQRSNPQSTFNGCPNVNTTTSNLVDHPVKRECQGIRNKVFDDEFVELPSTPPMVPKHLSDSVVIVPLNLNQIRPEKRLLAKKGNNNYASPNAFQVIEPSPSRISNVDRMRQQTSPSNSSLSDYSTSDEEHDVASVLCSFKGKSNPNRKPPTSLKKSDSTDSELSAKHLSKKRKGVSDASHKMRLSKIQKSLP